MSVKVERIKPNVGARIYVDHKDLTAPETIVAVHKALEECAVIVFPEFNATDEEQLAFTDAMGDRINFTRKVPGSDLTASDVYKITLDEQINTERDYVLGTFFWHIDGVTLDIPVPKGTVLSARALADEGGVTEFANLYAAYEHLPEDEKKQIANLRVIHTIEAAVRPVYGIPPQERLDRYRSMAEPMEHPLVWTHDDGRKSLLLGTHADAVVGMPGPHGRALLWRLQQWAAQPDFVYSHHWQIGDLVVWNNQGAMHRVVPYTDTKRTMHRTSIGGKERPGHLAAKEDVQKLLEPAI